MASGICELCGKGSKYIYGHHLSYENEEIIFLCSKCHKTIHGFSDWSYEQRNKAIRWIDKYSHEWIDGGEKYKKSNYYKTRQKEFYVKNADYRKTKRKEFYKEHPEYFTNYYQKNKEKIKNYSKEFRAKNPEYSKKYYQKNKKRLNTIDREEYHRKKSNKDQLSLNL